MRADAVGGSGGEASYPRFRLRTFSLFVKRSLLHCLLYS